MIKFFKKIRQKSLTENKIITYLLYAIGEIILFVIGILVAIQIDESYRNKANRNQERFYLEGIVKNIKVDIDRLDETILLDSKKVISGNVLLDHYKNPTKKKDALFLTHLLNLSTIRGYQQDDIIFNDIKSSGR